MHYQCSLAAAAGSRCTGARSGVVTERGSRGIGAAQKVIGPSMGVNRRTPQTRHKPTPGPTPLPPANPRGRFQMQWKILCFLSVFHEEASPKPVSGPRTAPRKKTFSGTPD